MRSRLELVEPEKKRGDIGLLTRVARVQQREGHVLSDSTSQPSKSSAEIGVSPRTPSEFLFLCRCSRVCRIAWCGLQVGDAEEGEFGGTEGEVFIVDGPACESRRIIEFLDISHTFTLLLYSLLLHSIRLYSLLLIFFLVVFF